MTAKIEFKDYALTATGSADEVKEQVETFIVAVAETEGKDTAEEIARIIENKITDCILARKQRR
jgi:hypothetical protein